MRKIICRFNNDSDIDSLAKKLNFFDKSVVEYDIDNQRILKSKIYRLPSQLKDKYECDINYVDMPEFQSKKIQAYHKTTFFTSKSSDELSLLFSQPITDKTKSIWIPKLVTGKNSMFRVVGGNSTNRYPIYVISKGRSTACKTSVYLSQMEVNHIVVVEPNEVQSYNDSLDLNYATIIPLDLKYKSEYDVFSDLGKHNGTGAGAARNFCWDHSINNGHLWHWVMDDNATEGFHWLYQNNKVKCRTGAFFCAIEDFVDRYNNIAIAGLNYSKFCKEIDQVPAYVLNTRIYSFLLIRNDINYRWRGRYNEDTDLSLRALKDGWCTIQFNSFLAGKITTQKMRGGNTDEFYIKEGTLNKSQMLKDMHPDVTKVVWKFNRWHHHVDYSKFKQVLNPIIDTTKLSPINNYGMKIIRTHETSTSNYKSELEKKYSELLANYEPPCFNEYGIDSIDDSIDTSLFF